MFMALKEFFLQCNLSHSHFLWVYQAVSSQVPKVLSSGVRTLTSFASIKGYIFVRFGTTVFPFCLHSAIKWIPPFLNFYDLCKRIQKQMITHLKALKQSIQNQERNWAWHHPEGGYALLTEKALPLLKFIWSLPWQKFFQFQNFFQIMCTV